jgi:hypothetical protein
MLFRKKRVVWYASVFVASVLGIVLSASAAQPFRMSFANVKVGQLPPGWVAAKTGEGPGSAWKVVEDRTASSGKALAQTSSEGPNSLFNLCIAEDTSFIDVDFAVALKAVAGKKDLGGGPVWRCQDDNNYYVARVNPLENNFRVYKVVHGKRTELASADVKAPAGAWHRLRVVHQGDHIQCFLNAKLMLDVHDATFAAAGKIGLWTKADAVTRFDDVQAR